MADVPMLDLLSVGSWSLFDHIFRLDRYPTSGETVTMNMDASRIQRTYFGDCSANLGVVAARLGVKAGLAMVVGDDFEATGYRSYLEELGIDLSGTLVRSNAVSGHSFLFFDEDGDGFCASHLGTAAEQTEMRLSDELVQAARAVVVSEQFSAFTLDAIVRARLAGKMTAINGMVGTAGSSAAAFLSKADYLFLSHDEFESLKETLAITDETAINRLGPKVVFVSMGREGGRILKENSSISYPVVPPDHLTDTTGAGDAFAGGALWALLRGLAPSHAARVGATVASFIIEDWGAQTAAPSMEQVEKRYKFTFQEELL